MKDIFKEPSASQSLLGKLMDDLLTAKHTYRNDFSLDKFIGEEAREAKKQIKLICRNSK